MDKMAWELLENWARKVTNFRRPPTSMSHLSQATRRRAAPRVRDTSIVLTPIALMGLMLLSIGVLSIMGGLGF